MYWTDWVSNGFSQMELFKPSTRRVSNEENDGLPESSFIPYEASIINQEVNFNIPPDDPNLDPAWVPQQY